MFDDYLRRLKDRVLAPLARRLGPGVSPNALTWAAFAAGLGSAGAAFAGRHGLGLTLWAINRTLDGLDGTQARYHDRQSAYGAYLDIVLDFVVYAAVPAALAFESALPEAVPAVVALLAAFYVNAASWMYLSAIDARRGALAETTTALTTVPMPPGIVAGTETVFAYVLFFLFPRQLPWLFLATALLVMANVVMRLWWGRRHLR